MKKLLLIFLSVCWSLPGFAGPQPVAGNGLLVPGAMPASAAKSQSRRKDSAKKQFMRQTGYPKGRKGYVVDHIVPRSKGGMDHPANMQWLKKADAKAKHKRERAHR
jgi:hypothetical protein